MEKGVKLLDQRFANRQVYWKYQEMSGILIYESYRDYLFVPGDCFVMDYANSHTGIIWSGLNNYKQ